MVPRPYPRGVACAWQVPDPEFVPVAGIWGVLPTVPVPALRSAASHRVHDVEGLGEAASGRPKRFRGQAHPVAHEPYLRVNSGPALAPRRLFRANFSSGQSVTSTAWSARGLALSQTSDTVQPRALVVQEFGERERLRASG